MFTALLIAYVSYRFGYRAIFPLAALMAIPAAFTLFSIDPAEISYTHARGLSTSNSKNNEKAKGISALAKDRVLVYFLAAVFLFHLANAAMLPQLGELLSKDNLEKAAMFMSACVIVTQLVISISAAWIGKRAAANGRKTLLLVGFGVLSDQGSSLHPDACSRRAYRNPDSGRCGKRVYS